MICIPAAVAACGGESSDSASGSEQVQSFAGTVQCDSIGGTPQSQVWETRVIFDRSVYRGMASEVSGAAGVQVGGLAGSVVKGGRSQVSATMASWSRFTGTAIDFKVSADPTSGTYAESGRWAVGVDANGKATLQGTSTAMLDTAPNASRTTCSWNLAAAQAPAGPVSYGLLEKTLTPSSTGSVSNKSLSASNSCGAGAFAAVTDGLYIGAAIAGFATGGATWALALSIGAVATTAGGQLAGALCPSSPMYAAAEQLAVMAAEIQQIDNYLGLATNVLYYKWYQLQVQNTQSAAYVWNTNINGISPQGSSTGLFGSFMDPSGVGLWNYQLQPRAGAPTNPAVLALDDTAFTNAYLQAVTKSSFFQAYLKQFSGTDVVVPNQSTCTTDCSGHVVQVPDSALIDLYRDLFSTLQSNIDLYVPQAQTYNAVANQNVVPLYDQYNAMLVKIWTQSVYAMQQALTMEWQVNQMNYFRGTSTASKAALSQIPSWGGVPGTLYQYGNQSLEVETDRYNAAQRHLAKLYAARVNQLYQNTLNYIVNDVPVAPQAYPIGSFSYSFNGVTYTERPVDYAGQLGKNISASTNGAQGPTPLSLVPVVANGTWTPAAVLYQFLGLKDAAACYSNMQAYNQTAGTAGTLKDWLQSNPNACPSIFTLADGSPLSYTCDTSDPSQCKGSVYDGNTLQPYTSYQAATGTTGGPIMLAASVPNNLKFCDPTSPALAWEPQRSGPALNCGRWYTPQYLAAGFPRANAPVANSDQYFYTDQRPVAGYGSLTRLGGDCSDNLVSPIGNKYPAMTTLTGSWPSGAPSSCAVIPSVALVGTGNLQSPRYTASRTESVNFETGNASQGCSIGWIGTGLLGNRTASVRRLWSGRGRARLRPAPAARRERRQRNRWLRAAPKGHRRLRATRIVRSGDRRPASRRPCSLRIPVRRDRRCDPIHLHHHRRHRLQLLGVDRQVFDPRRPDGGPLVIALALLPCNLCSVK